MFRFLFVFTIQIRLLWPFANQTLCSLIVERVLQPNVPLSPSSVGKQRRVRKLFMIALVRCPNQRNRLDVFFDGQRANAMNQKTFSNNQTARQEAPYKVTNPNHGFNKSGNLGDRITGSTQDCGAKNRKIPGKQIATAVRGKYLRSVISLMISLDKVMRLIFNLEHSHAIPARLAEHSFSGSSRLVQCCSDGSRGGWLS